MDSLRRLSVVGMVEAGGRPRGVGLLPFRYQSGGGPPGRVRAGHHRLDLFSGPGTVQLGPSWVAVGAPPPGACSDRPGAASWGPSRLDVFVRGRDNGLWQRFWTGAGWTGWLQPPGTQAGVLASAPSASPWGAGLLDGQPRLTVFVRARTATSALKPPGTTDSPPGRRLQLPHDVIVGAPGVVTTRNLPPMRWPVVPTTDLRVVSHGPHRDSSGQLRCWPCG